MGKKGPSFTAGGGTNYYSHYGNQFAGYPQIKNRALVGVAQWIEHHPGNHRVTGLIPSQGTGLGCGPGPQ